MTAIRNNCVRAGTMKFEYNNVCVDIVPIVMDTQNKVVELEKCCLAVNNLITHLQQDLTNCCHGATVSGPVVVVSRPPTTTANPTTIYVVSRQPLQGPWRYEYDAYIQPVMPHITVATIMTQENHDIGTAQIATRYNEMIAIESKLLVDKLTKNIIPNPNPGWTSEKVVTTKLSKTGGVYPTSNTFGIIDYTKINPPRQEKIITSDMWLNKSTKSQ